MKRDKKEPKDTIFSVATSVFLLVSLFVFMGQDQPSGGLGCAGCETAGKKSCSSDTSCGLGELCCNSKCQKPTSKVNSTCIACTGTWVGDTCLGFKYTCYRVFIKFPDGCIKLNDDPSGCSSNCKGAGIARPIP